MLVIVLTSEIGMLASIVRIKFTIGGATVLASQARRPEHDTRTTNVMAAKPGS